MQQEQQLKIDVSQTSEVKCENCGSTMFKQVFYMREIPAVLSGTGQPAMYPIPTFACDNCSHINKEFTMQLPPTPEENSKTKVLTINPKTNK